MEVEHEEDIPEVFLKTEDGDGVQLEAEVVGEEPFSTQVMVRTDAPDSPQVVFYPLRCSGVHFLIEPLF